MEIQKIVIVNLLTAMRVLTSLLLGYCILKHCENMIFVLILLAIVCATDILDGRLARRWMAVTKAGSAFDVIADLFFLNVSYIALILRGIIPFWILLVAELKFLEFCITSYIAGKRLQNINTALFFDKLGKLSAVLLLILPLIGIIIEYNHLHLYDWVVICYSCVVSIMVCISSIYRIIKCYYGIRNNTAVLGQ